MGARTERFVHLVLATVVTAVGTWRVPVAAQAPAPAKAAAQPLSPRVFASDAGLVLNFVKADKAADFEMVIGKLKEVLRKSAKPERRKQAEGWKVFKSPDPIAGGSVLYVFVIDPVVQGSDYTVSTAFAEGLTPTEVTEVYTKYAEAYSSGQNVVNMTLVSDFGQAVDSSAATAGGTPSSAPASPETTASTGRGK